MESGPGQIAVASTMKNTFPMRSRFIAGAFPSRNYARAPITEAIISLNVEFSEGFQLSTVAGFGNQAFPEYVIAGEERTWGILATPTAVSPQRPSISGYRFVDSIRNYAVVCRANSFGVSKLAPYQDWDTFCNEAKRLWAAFKQAHCPSRVTSISLRYINKIDIPLTPESQIDIRWYLRTYPEVSSDIDLGMSNFQMRLDIPIQSIGARLILNQALLPPTSPEPNALSVVLDSDILAIFEEDPDEKQIWERFLTLRQAKNDIFEASITNLTRELFQ